MIYIASDEVGFEMKEDTKKYLLQRGYKVEDLGPVKPTPVSYAEYAEKVTKKVLTDPNARGILFSGTGIGMCVAANKVKGIYAAVVFNEQMAEEARQVNSTNILCLPVDYINTELTREIASIWLSTSFSGVEHYVDCLREVREMESKNHGK